MILTLLLLFTPYYSSAATPALLERYVQLRQRAEISVEEFDRQLEADQSGPGFLERSHAYRELIALRHLIEGTEEEFMAGYRNSTPATRLALRAKISAASGAARSSVADLVRAAENAGITDLPALFSSELELLAHEAAHPVKARKSPALEEEIRAMIRDLALDEATLAGVRPSPGKDGNITGNTFPTNTWALTYDDGPHEKYTLPILANLQRYGKKATFFWLAQNLEPNRAVVEKVKAAGHALANHSYSHANLPKVSSEKLRQEIEASTQVQARFYGYRPAFFRCPYGAGLNVARIRQMIADQGMIHVFWNVDSLDWQDKNPASIHARVKKQMLAEKKGVVLFHDIQPPTLEASRLLMEYSRGLDGTSNAIRWVTLPQITRELP
jgi:peptidoglycan/xylan/chitin deacetylase (PgdA/CDA1 family)